MARAQQTASVQPTRFRRIKTKLSSRRAESPLEPPPEMKRLGRSLALPFKSARWRPLARRASRSLHGPGPGDRRCCCSGWPVLPHGVYFWGGPHCGSAGWCGRRVRAGGAGGPCQSSGWPARASPGPDDRTRAGSRAANALGIDHGARGLILPEELWCRLDAVQQDAVLAHELAHLKRRDHWVRRLEAVVLGLYWWYPAPGWPGASSNEPRKNVAMPGSSGPCRRPPVLMPMRSWPRQSSCPGSANPSRWERAGRGVLVL